jgi:hypothetical protein
MARAPRLLFSNFSFLRNIDMSSLANLRFWSSKLGKRNVYTRHMQNETPMANALHVHAIIYMDVHVFSYSLTFNGTSIRSSCSALYHTNLS